MQKMPDTDFSFKNFFTPLTTAKAITIIIGVGLIVYFNMLFNGFVWDDYPQLVNNPLLQSWTNLVPIFLNHSYTYYRPFSDFVFAILYSVFNTTAFWYHLFQLILQITNTILVFLLFKKFFRPTISFILSIIFLVHPLQVETVSYISSLQNVLSLFLSLLALFIIMVKGIQPKYKYGTLFIILLFASLTKEIALVFIVVIFAFMKLNPQYVFSKKEYIYTGITLALVIFCYLIFRFLIGGMTPIVTNNTFVLIMTASFWMKILTLPKIIFYYLFTFIFPKDLAISQQWLVKIPGIQNFYLPLIVDIIFFLSLGICAIYLTKTKSKESNAFTFFLILFLISWLIAWQLVPLDMTIADRWFYIPMVGLLGMLGVLINSQKILGYQRIIIVFLIFIIISFSVRTMVRNSDWNNQVSLFTHDENLSNSYDLEILLAQQYLNVNANDQAKPHIDKSIILAPTAWENWNNLGVYYQHKGNYDRAIWAFSKAIDNNKNFFIGYLNIANIYYRKSPKDGDIYLTNLVEKYPNNMDFLYLKGLAE